MLVRVSLFERMLSTCHAKTLRQLTILALRHLEMATLLESYDNVIVSIDDVSPPTGQDVVAKTCFYGGIVLVVAWWVCKNENDTNANPRRQRQQERVAITGSELGLGEIPQDEASHYECVICLETMPPGTIVRILPCRHVYHHDCIVLWLNGNHDTCPLCKFDIRQHLEEQGRADASLDEPRPDDSASNSRVFHGEMECDCGHGDESK
jgi:hypothetical protein